MGLWLGYYNIECSKASINQFDENANSVLVKNFLLKNKIGRFRSTGIFAPYYKTVLDRQ